MNTSTNLHIGDDDEINFYSELSGRISVTLGHRATCAWLHLSPAAARCLVAVLADALADLPASASPSSPGVEADGAPAGHRLPAGATTKDPS